MEQTPWLNPIPRAILLDAGFTLTFCHGGRISELAAAHGVRVEAAAIEIAENEVRREMAKYVWPATRQQHAEQTAQTSTAGPAFFRRLLECAAAEAVSTDRLDVAAAALWEGHLTTNLWCRVGAGVVPALERLRAAGMKLVVVSNSEGTVEAMLRAAGLRDHLDAVVDSWVVGFAKPHPRIFEVALAAVSVPAADAVMVGDTPAADVEGARAAGVRAVLVDPLDLHPTIGIPRVPDLASFADRLLASAR